jgi:hypothetical protein
MKEKILEQTTKELKTAAWIDMLIMVVGVVVTLHLFALAAITAGMSVGSISDAIPSGGILGALAHNNPSFNVVPFIIMIVALAVIVIINWYGVRMLMKNKKQRAQANEGLVKLYKDEGLDQYSDGSIYKSYENRYNLFGLILGSLGAMSVVVTLIIFINQLTNL